VTAPVGAAVFSLSGKVICSHCLLHSPGSTYDILPIADGFGSGLLKPSCLAISSVLTDTPEHLSLTMIFSFILLDKPDAAELRQRVRPEHKAYLAAVCDRIAFAGPLVQDDGHTMLGSLLAIEFASRDAAHAWLTNEPFFRAGLFASTTIHAFNNLWPQRAGFAVAV
jgi:uncharacterized protein YciI